MTKINNIERGISPMEDYIGYGLGSLKSSYDVRDYKLAAQNEVTLPLEFSLTQTKVKNQGSVGSCVAHALSSVVEYFNFIQNNASDAMSTGYIYGNRQNSFHKGYGMYIREALSNLRNYGDVYHADFPYNIETPEGIDKFEESFAQLKDKGIPHRISSYYKLSTIDEIKYSLMHNGPVVFSIEWFSDLKVDAVNVMQSARLKRQSTGYHCMIIYGWNEYGWKIQNSWGLNWGDYGRAILPFDYPLDEAWGVIDTITDTEVEIKKPFSSWIAKKFAKVINFFANIFQKFKGAISNGGN